MIQLSYQISPDRRTLTIVADDAARAELREWGDNIRTDRALWDAFEYLVCNTELDWIAPEVCGDLTDAPILGICGPDRETRTPYRDGQGVIEVGSNGFRGVWTVMDVTERWAFMSYQVRSPLEDLLDTGRAEFTAP